MPVILLMKPTGDTGGRWSGRSRQPTLSRILGHHNSPDERNVLQERKRLERSRQYESWNHRRVSEIERSQHSVAVEGEPGEEVCNFKPFVMVR